MQVQKKWLVVWFIVMLGIMAGCSSSESGTESTSKKEGKWAGQTLTVHLIGDFSMEDATDPITGKTNEGLNSIKQEFEKQHPGATVEFILMPWEGYTEKTQAMITSNEADVYQMPGLADFAAQGVLEPLQSYIEEDPEFSLDVFIENQVSGWKVLGPDSDELSIYGLPLIGDARFINYDKKLFDQWGVEYLSDNPTMEEIARKAKQMTGTNPVTGEENYGIWFRGDWSSAFTLVNLAEGQNGRWGTGFAWDEIQFEYNSPEMVNGLEWLLEMQEYAPDGLISNQGAERWLTDRNNIAIMLNQGPGDLILPVYAQGLEDRIGIAQEFNNDDGIGGMFAGSPVAMAKESDNKELAWEWIKFSVSEDFQRYLFEEANAMPVIKAAEDWESYKEVEKMMNPTIEAMRTPWTPRYPWASSQPRFILTSEIEAALAGKRSAKEALDKAQEESKAWLDNR
ncbi:extracellular solute-binding protein [Gracilibacillus dipsosauri]|nr:extracellular solute-binding protein [Gracilibacillus dipsosauri]